MTRFVAQILRPPVRGASWRLWKYRMVEDYACSTRIPLPLPPAGLPVAEVVLEFLQFSWNGVLILRSGYAWDGASGPALDTANFLRGSAVHDALYQLIREGILPLAARKAADRLLRTLCRQDGMNSVRAWWVYRSVRWGGGRALKGGKP